MLRQVALGARTGFLAARAAVARVSGVLQDESCLRCGAEERATSGMDGSTEFNPVAGETRVCTSSLERRSESRMTSYLEICSPKP